jgi:hypothetical protein
LHIVNQPGAAIVRLDRLGVAMPSPSELPLLERTKLLLEEATETRTLKQIAIGAGVGEPWLCRFNGGKIPNPGIHHVQLLHDYLTGLGD